MKEIAIRSSLDGQMQKALCWMPAEERRRPAVVFLHSWSADYRQDNPPWLAEAQRRGWGYVQPDFRGPNNRAQAGGSELAQRDVLDCADWLRTQSASIDGSRLMLAGVSGGGHMAMLMAARSPMATWRAVSAWVGISDLSRWYREHAPNGVAERYAKDIVACCGGAPGTSPTVDQQLRLRSPLGQLAAARDVPIDLNAGVHDGHTGSVPIAHTLLAFNELARAQGAREISNLEIDELMSQRRLAHPDEVDRVDEPSYGRPILLRRHAGPSRVTIFEGGHEGIASAAFDWFDRHASAAPSPTASAAASAAE